MSSPFARVLFVIAFTVLAIIAWSLLLNAMKNSTLFFPERYPAGFWNMSYLPVQPSEHWIETPDGIRLHALLFEAPNDPEAPFVVHCHGNGGNLSYRAPIAAELAMRGVSTLIFDYRGYGRSDGTPDEKELEIDALAAYDYVHSKLAIPPERIAVFGESLGGAYAALIASKHPVRCVVIESSFPSARAVAATMYPLGPLLFPLNGSLPTAERLSNSKAPVLVFHGTNDEIIAFKLGKQLFESLRVDKEFIPVKGAGHNDVLDVGGEPLYDRIAAFVRQ